MWRQDTENPDFLILKCNLKCNCRLQKLKQYTCTKTNWSSKNPRKGGIILSNQDDKGVRKHLIIQSRGRLWGIPKGSLKEGEDARQCALRELEEETAIKKKLSDITHEIKIKQSKYYYAENEECVNPGWTLGSDATGGGWCTTRCMKNWIANDLLKTTRVYSKVLDSIW